MTPNGWGWVPAVVALLALCCEVVKVYGGSERKSVAGEVPTCQSRLTEAGTSRSYGRMMMPTYDMRWMLLKNLLIDAEGSRTTRDRLVALMEVAAAVAELRADTVREWTAEGATWHEVGQVLGVTRQAAWQRYAGHERE